MARSVQAQGATGVHYGRHFTVAVVCPACARHDCVQFDWHRVQRRDRCADWAQAIGDLPQHDEHLALFVDQRRTERVAELDGGGRLDEERAGAAGFVVDDPFGAAPRIATHWNHISTTPHRDAGATRDRSAVTIAQHAFESPHQPFACGVDFASRGSKCRAGRIEQFAVIANRDFQQALDAAIDGRDAQCCDARTRLGLTFEFLRRFAAGRKRDLDRCEIRDFEHAAVNAQSSEGAAHIGHRPHLKSDAAAQHGEHFTHEYELRANPLDVVGRQAGAQGGGAEGTHGTIGDDIEHMFELERGQRFGRHGGVQAHRGAVSRKRRHPGLVH